MNDRNIARRRLLEFLLASPLLAAAPRWLLAAGEAGLADAPLGELIASADQALDVFDFQRVAAQVLPPAHYGYLATGTDGDETLHANRAAFDRLYLRASRMVDTSVVDTRLELFGQPLPSPIVLAPVGSLRAFHPEGEAAAARATRARGHLQILSSVTTTPIAEVAAARGRPPWFQLYPTADWSVTEVLLRRAEKAGAPVVVLTVDLNSGSNRVALERYIRLDDRDCKQCHDHSNPDDWLKRKPMYEGTAATTAKFDVASMTWDFVGRLKAATPMKVVVKGLVTAEDAAQAVASGADGIVVSNHGGRAEASGWATIDSLPEVVDAVGGRVPVLVDSGFRRGTDIFKALALGATAVCVGRPYAWGLAAFGQAGVEKVLALLDAELAMVMGQVGTPTLAAIGRARVGRH